MITVCLITLLLNNIIAETLSEDVSSKKHHEDDGINQKMEQYYKLLDKKKNAIDKFLKDNYSDFNHSDYTPEVRNIWSRNWLLK